VSRILLHAALQSYIYTPDEDKIRQEKEKINIINQTNVRGTAAESQGGKIIPKSRQKGKEKKETYAKESLPKQNGSSYILSEAPCFLCC